MVGSISAGTQVVAESGAEGLTEAFAEAKEQCGVSYTLSFEFVKPVCAMKVATASPAMRGREGGRARERAGGRAGRQEGGRGQTRA
jgi:hypothetical protein